MPEFFWPRYEDLGPDNEPAFLDAFASTRELFNRPPEEWELLMFKKPNTYFVRYRRMEVPLTATEVAIETQHNDAIDAMKYAAENVLHPSEAQREFLAARLLERSRLKLATSNVIEQATMHLDQWGDIFSINLPSQPGYVYNLYFDGEWNSHLRYWLEQRISPQHAADGFDHWDEDGPPPTGWRVRTRAHQRIINPMTNRAYPETHQDTYISPGEYDMRVAIVGQLSSPKKG